VVLEGGWPARRALLRGAARNGFYDRDEGYLLDVRWSDSVGYNIAPRVLVVGLGWKLNEHPDAARQYALIDIDLVRGPSLHDAVEDADSWPRAGAALRAGDAGALLARARRPAAGGTVAAGGDR
jgi:hypothetical protein